MDLSITDHFPQRRPCMDTLTWLITGGFTKGRHTQVLGVTTALLAIALWAVGDMSLADLSGKLPIALGGLGLAALAPSSTTQRRRRRQEPSPQRQNEVACRLSSEA
jgi:hypothetical protein